MIKIITRDQTIELKNTCNLFPKDISANDIRIEGDSFINLFNLNLNIAKYDIDDNYIANFIRNSSINKLILNLDGQDIRIYNSNIQNIYIQSEMEELHLINTNIPNLHGRIDLIDKIEIEQ